MSGHSKFANIKHKKEKNDAAKGKIFTVIGREIAVAVKEGVPMASAEVTMIPDNYVTLTDPEDIKNLNRTLDLLDEDDDVQAVYHNWEEE